MNPPPLNLAQHAHLAAQIAAKDLTDITWILQQTHVLLGLPAHAHLSFAHKVQRCAVAPQILSLWLPPQPLPHPLHLRLSTALAARLGEDWRFPYLQNRAHPHAPPGDAHISPALYRQLTALDPLSMRALLNDALSTALPLRPCRMITHRALPRPLAFPIPPPVPLPQPPPALNPLHAPPPINPLDPESEGAFIYTSAVAQQSRLFTSLDRILRETSLFQRSLRFPGAAEDARAIALWALDVPLIIPTPAQVRHTMKQIKDGRRWAVFARELGPGFLVMVAAGSASGSFRGQELGGQGVVGVVAWVRGGGRGVGEWAGTWGARVLRGCVGVFDQGGPLVPGAGGAQAWGVRMAALVAELPGV